jgi:CHAT domain-containing protein/Tfp pilus assembly protein PilF
MSGKVFLAMLSFLMVLSLKSHSQGAVSYRSVREAYNQADKLFNGTNNSTATDSACIKAFTVVIRSLMDLPRTTASDSLLFESNCKLGILCDEFKNYDGANASYLNALHYSRKAGDKFRICVLAGAVYYNLNNFDSATYFLLQAEEIPGEVGSSEDRVRLYNTLGVLYYDNGNYLQSKNYFSQALRLIESKDLPEDLKIYTQLNLATCSYKLGLFDQTLTIYKKLLHSSLPSDPLYLNMGKAYSGLHQYAEALSSYRKVNILSEPGVLNEMARTALETGNTDSAIIWLKQYDDKKKSLHSNILDDGINDLYSGNLALKLNKPELSLPHLQEALIIFSRNFTDSDPRKNPVSFTGSFAYYRLFEVLVTKASAWEMIYQKTSKPGDLRSANDCYQSAITLLSYIERSYEMDDAKILLKQKSGGLYAKALNVCIQLSALYPNENFLESAFLISEKNKASVMSAQIRESRYLLSAGSDGNLADERNIKYNIARLNSLADQGGDANALRKINEEKALYETRLVTLRRKMEGNKRFYQWKYADDFPSVKMMQVKMDPDKALISFFNEPDKIYVFLLTRSTLRFIQLDSGVLIRRNIQSWVENLQSAENGNHIHNAVLKKNLYEQLMKPVIDVIGNKTEWVVVPDGIFFLLPVESLPGDAEGNLVIEKRAVSYEFSARFIMREESNAPLSGIIYPALSFAPYSQRGADLQLEGMGKFEKLPYSNVEIAGLAGSRFTDRDATKSAFLNNLNHFPIVHLATHAKTDLENSSASYISFYPSSGLRSEDFIFLDEIYSFRMDSCQMMVISACETGRGELVRNEGVMSFARAFLYAGCPSTINTLWKADDYSTAEILRRFYNYLNAGDSKSRALQKAKLDFIRENPVFRNPAYWSHIVIMGNADALYKKKQPRYLWAALGISFSAFMFIVIRNKKKKSRRLS